MAVSVKPPKVRLRNGAKVGLGAEPDAHCLLRFDNHSAINLTRSLTKRSSMENRRSRAAFALLKTQLVAVLASHRNRLNVTPVKRDSDHALKQHALVCEYKPAILALVGRALSGEQLRAIGGCLQRG